MGAAPSPVALAGNKPGNREGALRCQRRRREAGGFAVPGRGRRGACGRPSPSRGFARCVVRWRRARALQGLHCSCPLRNQERIWEGGQWAPPPPLVPASPSAYLHRAIRVDAGMPDAWTCCRTRRVERRNRLLADRAVLPRREEWRRTTSATSPVLKSFFFRLLYITSRS
ncbi:hypothetical protein PVAP13_7KG256055 [Panicum virgatum]|uniref:Uncharacterized protein n=1 Tax=Panicum virgatum TaxID=38727 RepID=A0A8T0QIH9_PANVG|nr:hypothetical protein PVAP13_7KG256055 [Panicum virgatum]